jgi:hypothetical protein
LYGAPIGVERGTLVQLAWKERSAAAARSTMQRLTPRTVPAQAAAAAATAAPAGTGTLAARRRPASRLLPVVRHLVHEHAGMFALLFAYLGVALSLQLAYPDLVTVRLHFYNEVFFIILEAYTIVFLTAFAFIEARHVPKGHSVLRWVWRALRRRYLTLERVGAFLLALVYARVLTDTFISLKAAIPMLQPFSWDETFMQWDRALHGGQDPWRLLQPYMTPSLTSTLSFLYNLWIFILFATFLSQAWSETTLLRKRFFITFGLAWMLLGTAAATALSSAGPCYYAGVTHASTDPYAPLMTYLHSVSEKRPVWSLDVQDALWVAHVSSTHGKLEQPVHQPDWVAAMHADPSVKDWLNGISAMPSMHVAMAVLFALLGWNVSLWLGAALTVYAAAIEVGSVHLGWHYALDGYESATAVIVLWFVVGRILGRQGAARRLTA